jgi:glutathione peroxidase
MVRSLLAFPGTMAISVSSVTVRDAQGTERQLGDWSGQVLLIVNVASRCGFTRQYAGLQALQETYGPQGFTVLGFPCNDFGAQEPGTLAEIQQFCSTTYGASFPLFDKVHATGAKTEPYTTLTQVEPAGDVAWNFEKFLIAKDGTVLARFKSAVEPDSAELKAAIEAALAA